MSVCFFSLKVVLINTFTEKVTIFQHAVFSIVADHLALGCHDNVHLEPNIPLFLALVDLVEII